MLVRFANTASGSGRLEEFVVADGTTLAAFFDNEDIDFNSTSQSVAVRQAGSVSSNTQPLTYTLREGDIVTLAAVAKSGG